MRPALFALPFTFGLALAACSETSSDSAPPTNLSALFGAHAYNGRLIVDATFFTPEDYVALTGAEKLVAELNGQRTDLELGADTTGMPYYTAELAAPAADAPLAITLEGSTRFPKAPRSVVTMPGAFTLELPASISEGDTITVRLSRKPAEELALGFDGDCLARSGRNIFQPIANDGASFTFMLDKLDYADEERTCTVNASIARPPVYARALVRFTRLTGLLVGMFAVSLAACQLLSGVTDLVIVADDAAPPPDAGEDSTDPDAAADAATDKLTITIDRPEAAYLTTAGSIDAIRIGNLLASERRTPLSCSTSPAIANGGRGLRCALAF